MLRLILSISGVGLILLGLFGGGALNSVYERFNGEADLDTQAMGSRTTGSQTTESLQTQNDSRVAIEVPAVAETDGMAATAVAKESATVAVVDKAPAGEPLTDTGQAVAQVTPAATVTIQPVEADSSVASNTQNNDTTESTTTPLAVADVNAAGSEDSEGLVAIGEEVVASAADQAPVSQLQQKASARNDQVALAKTILTSTSQAEPLNVAVTDKSGEVDQLLSATAGQAGNDVLVVTKDKVNLRKGPSIDHPVILTLEQGQELMEFKREGKWVHVGAYGTSGKIGWVHQRLVGAGE